MAEPATPRKIPLVFFRSLPGREPVREWLKGLDEAGRQAIGTDLPTKRTARVLLCLYREHRAALHGFIKETPATPKSDLATARKHQKELER